MKLKMDGDKVVLQDGKPVYTADDGREMVFDAAQTYSKITQLTEGEKSQRLRAEAAEQKLQTFDGITDPEAAKKAIETIANIDAGQLVQAGKVEEIKRAAKEAAEQSIADAKRSLTQQIEQVSSERDKIKARFERTMIENAFATSQFIKTKVVSPLDMLQATFGPRFSIDENDKIIATGSDGKPIVSKSKFGEPADFEEAIAELIKDYPNKNQILAGTNYTGPGSRPGGALPANGIDPKLPPQERMTQARAQQASR